MALSQNFELFVVSILVFTLNRIPKLDTQPAGSDHELRRGHRFNISVLQRGVKRAFTSSSKSVSIWVICDAFMVAVYRNRQNDTINTEYKMICTGSILQKLPDDMTMGVTFRRAKSNNNFITTSKFVSIGFKFCFAL